MKIKMGIFLALIFLFILPHTVFASGFQPYIVYETGSIPEAVAIGDVNGDGKKDVVMTTSFKDPENDRMLLVFLQNTAGGLNPLIKYSVSGRPTSVNICDLNNDGKKDVVVGNDRVNIEVFIQDQSGGLNSGVIYNTTNSTSIKTGDFNNDGLMDVAGIGWGSGSVDILFQKGDGLLGTPTTYSVQHGGYDDLDAGDVNNDGLTDLIVMNGQGLLANIGLLYQQANGFSLPAYYSVSGGVLTHGVAVGDINNDKLNDIIVSHGYYQSFIATFNQNSHGTLNPAVNHAAYNGPESVGSADLNSDGKMDIIALNREHCALSLYLQDSSGGMMPYSHYTIPYASYYNPQGLAIGDINSDGAVDVAIANNKNGLVLLYNILPYQPATPVNLAGNSLNNFEADLIWNVSIGASSYNIYRSDKQHGTYTKVGSKTANSFKDTGLQGSTTYWYKVSAVNAFGEGNQTEPVSITVMGMGPPLNLTANSLNNNEADLAWDSSIDATSYNVYRSDNQNGPYTKVGNPTANSFKDTGLLGSTTYWYKLSAVNTFKETTQTTPVSVTVMGMAAPVNLTGESFICNEVELTWDASIDAMSYNVYRSDSENGTYIKVGNPTANSFKDTGLGLSTYWYKVSAVNAFGESALASPVSVSVLRIAAPEHLTANNLNYNEVELNWDASIGATSYNVYRSNNQNGLYTEVGNPTANSFKDIGLQKSTTYWYKVSAVNAFGASVETSSVNVTVIIGIATPVHLTGESFTCNEVELTWDATIDATSYNVYRSDSESGTYIKVGNPTSNSFKETGLQGSTTYWYKVSGVSDYGESAKTDPVFVTVAVVGVPTGLTATGVSRSQIILEWNAVSDATNYYIYWKKYENQTYTLLGTSTANSILIFGLQAGSSYMFEVSAANSKGVSSKSSMVRGWTLTATTLAAPSGLTATGVSNSQINLKWNVVIGAEKYIIYRARSKDGPYIYLETSKTPTATTDGITANTTYWYKVSALNQWLSEGLQSTGVSGKTLASSTIAAPSGLTATGLSNSQIYLNWTAVTGASKYIIYSATSQSGSYSYVGTSTTNGYLNPGLNANTKYWYKVSAVDRMGEGLQSTEVSGETLTTSSIGAITGLTAIGVNESQINLNWTAATGADKYKIYRASSQTGTYSCVGTSTTNGYFNTGLSGNTTYWYKVIALFGSIEGDYSIEVSAKTTTNVPTGLTVSALSSSELFLKWSAVGGAGSYNIYQATSATAEFSKIGITTSASYNVSGLPPSTAFWYKITAVNSAGESPLSAFVTATTKLVSPPNLTVVPVSNTQIDLSWDSLPWATSYNIYRSTNMNGTYSKVGMVKTNSYQNKSLSWGTTYWYKVTALKGNTEGEYSTLASAQTKPNTPVGLTAKALSASSITLKWTAVSGASSYKIYQATGATAEFNPIDEITSSTFDVTELPSNTTTWYKVTAVNGSGESPLSLAVSATTKLPAPSGLSVTVISAAEIDLGWDSLGWATSYNIYRSTSENGVYRKIGTTKQNSYQNKNLKSATVYWYKITALQVNTQGDYSNPESGTTQ